MQGGFKVVLLRKPKYRRDKRPFGLYLERCRKKSKITLYKAVKRNLIENKMNKSDLIDKYIKNKATPEELEEIRKLMKEDVEFKKELSFQLELREAIRREESQKLKQHLQSLEQEKKSFRIVPMLWKIAAVFVIGLGLLWFFNMSPDYEKLYASYYTTY